MHLYEKRSEYTRTRMVQLAPYLGAASRMGAGFSPLNSIEKSVSDLIDERVSTPVHRTAAAITAEDAIAMLEPGSILVDCTGSRSLLRDHLTPGTDDLDSEANTLKVRSSTTRTSSSR